MGLKHDISNFVFSQNNIPGLTKDIPRREDGNCVWRRRDGGIFGMVWPLLGRSLFQINC